MYPEAYLVYIRTEGLEKGPNILIANFPLRWTVRNMGKLFDEGINLVITSKQFHQCIWIQRLKQ